jgi:HupE/UreJ protein
MGRSRSAAATLVAAIVLALAPAAASGHHMPTSQVLLAVGSSEVGGEVALPVDRLAVALQRHLTPAEAAGPLRAQIARYTRRHIHAVGADGEHWKVTVGGGHIERTGLVDRIVMSLSLTPPRGKVTDFDLRYDAIIGQLVTHKAIATIRSQWNTGATARDPEPVGVYDWRTQSLRVDVGDGSWARGLVATAVTAVQDVGGRADHLLFLLLLLLPAPLVAGRACALRVAQVVVAFAIGQSIALASATYGLIHAPHRLVQILLALSILVAAAHALKPRVRGGEAMIAAGFGLVHGLAFATLLGDLGFSSDVRASSLLGFSLGVEATQLLVVALMMPSLYALSRSAAYAAVRVPAAFLAIVLAGAWLLERATLVGSDPFAPVSTAATAHPFGVAALIALLAAATRYLPGVRTRPAP